MILINRFLLFLGKIEKTDWNVKEIEKKIEENKMGRGIKSRQEKVPKWSREQFADKVIFIIQYLKVFLINYRPTVLIE